MAYGIEIKGYDGTNEFLVLDSTVDMVNYRIVGQGTASSLNINTTGGTGGQRPILMVQKTTGGGIISVQRSGTNDAVHTFYSVTENTDTNGDLTSISLTQTSVNYVLLKDMTGGSLDGNSYGIQVLTSNSDVAFDSRKFGGSGNDSFRLTSVVGTGSVIGNFGDVDSDYLKYVDFRQCYVYEAPGGSEGEVVGFSWDSVTGIEYIAYYFSYQGLGAGGRANYQRYTPNRSAIIVGEKR